MKKIYLSITIIMLAATCVVYTACKKNANGRNTLSLVDDATIMSLSSQQYAEFINANPPVTGTPDAARVADVGARLVDGVQRYLASKGQSDLIKDYQWEFRLVNSPEVNAWCLPGGKIVVYTGILSMMPTDADMAVVLGHEICHAILKHGSERMSQQLLVEYGGTALSVLLSSKPAETQQHYNTAFGISSNLGVLAFSRKQESEADETGLYVMATANYDPNAAVGLWQRMAAQGGSSTPVFMSTHPSDEQRIKDIQAKLPKAMEYYNP